MFIVVAFLLFSAAMFGCAYYVWAMPAQRSAEVLDARLRGVRVSARGERERGAADLIRTEKRGPFAVLGDFVNWLGVVRRLQVYIVQANLQWRAADVTAICLGIAILVFLASELALGNIALRLLVALVAGYAPIFWIMRARDKRLRKFESQLPDAIDLFTRSMRAGHNIHSGLETIANETSDPARMEFRKVIEELALGSQIEPSLHRLGERVPIVDLKFFMTGLILQRQTGANMVEVLENLATLVRERLNLAAKMKAHTAQQRFSAGLLCALPVVVGIGFWVVKPEMMSLLWTDPLGSKAFTYAVISELIGILIIRKLSNVKA